jgi:hypothetical protein
MDILSPFAGAMRLGRMAAFEIFEFFLSEKQNRGMLLECPSSLQETDMAELQETAIVERSRKSRPTAGLCAAQRGADELRRRFANSSSMNEGGNFPVRKASRTRKTRKGSRHGRASFASLLAPSRACPDMAPQRLEKIESAPGNGRASEVSNPQHLVHGRAAHRALRRTNLGAPPTSQRPRFTNSKRRKATRKFFASQPPEIAQNRKRISEAPTAQWPRSTNSTHEKAARKNVAEKGA